MFPKYGFERELFGLFLINHHEEHSVCFRYYTWRFLAKVAIFILVQLLTLIGGF